MPHSQTESEMNWWQASISIFIWPLELVFILVLSVLLMPLAVVQAVVEAQRERRNAEFLRWRGRIIAWCDLKPRIDLGEGTIILEWWYPSGPQREWWTEDDLVSMLDADTPSWRHGAQSHQKQKLTHRAAEIAKEYTHVELGRARLIDRSCARGKYPQRIWDECPRANVITLVQSEFDPSARPMLYAGDFLDANCTMMEFDSGIDPPRGGAGM